MLVQNLPNNPLQRLALQYNQKGVWLSDGEDLPTHIRTSTKNMQYSKAMIDLVFQIRKTAPAPVKARIKLTNPDLPATLIDIYKVVDDQPLKILIYEFLNQAGPEWLSGLATARKTVAAEVPVLEDTVRDTTDTTPARPAPPREHREKVVIYRGQRMVVPA